jgi:hypothetical protein
MAWCSCPILGRSTGRSDGGIDLVFAIRGGCYELARFGFLFELVWSIAVVSWLMALINLTFVSLHV